MKNQTKKGLFFSPVLKFTTRIFAILSVVAFSSGCEKFKDFEDKLDDKKKNEPVTFEVTIENVSTPNLLETERANGTVPLSPGVYATYTGENPLFMPGQRADNGTARIAEDGFPSIEANSLSNNEDIIMSGIFQSAGGPDNGPALAAGESATFTVTAMPGARLQIETMFVQSNDFFYAFGDEGLSLFQNSKPVSGDVTSELVLYDAGTEGDTPPGTGEFQKPVQEPRATNFGPDDSVKDILPAMEKHPDFNIPPASEVIKVTVSPQN